jgi:hypothetical protein
MWCYDIRMMEASLYPRALKTCLGLFSRSAGVHRSGKPVLRKVEMVKR